MSLSGLCIQPLCLCGHVTQQALLLHVKYVGGKNILRACCERDETETATIGI